MDEQDLAMWVVIYSALIGFQNHPGTKVPRTAVQLAADADLYFQQYMLRKIGEVKPWGL